MKRSLLFSLLISFTFVSAQLFGQAIITNVYDGPLPGGEPKGVELYIPEAIADLSALGIGSANNGGGSDSVEFSFPAVSVEAGTYLYVASDSTGFADFFGFNADYITAGNPNAMSINGDDAVELFWNGDVIDIFGEIDVDGSGTGWDHLDGWASRKPGTGPDGSSFMLQNWNFSGIDALDNETTNATATNPVPFQSYTNIVEPDFTVILENLVFTPRNLTIELGQTVRFTNVETNVEHNVNGNTNVFPCNPAGFFSGSAALGVWDFDVTFNAAGLYNYQCDPHIAFDMVGTVTVVDPNAPSYPDRTIAEVTTEDPNGAADSLNTNVTLTGVVHSDNFSTDGLQFALINDSGEGITVFESSNTCYSVTMGDMISVSGRITQFNGLTQINNESIIEILSQGNALLNPETINSTLGEDTESRFVRVEDLVVQSIAATGSSGWNVEATNANGAFQLRLDSDVISESFANSLSGTLINAQGIGGQFDNSSPFDEGYQLLPRGESDIEILSSVTNLPQDAVWIYPNPTPSTLRLESYFNMESIRVFSLDGRLLSIGKYGGENVIEIDVSDLKSGFYLIQVKSNEGLWNSRFIRN